MKTNQRPTERGVYVWRASDGSAFALVQVHNRPSADRGGADVAPGGPLKASVINSTTFYDGCVVDDSPHPQWGDGYWIRVDKDSSPVEVDADVAKRFISALEGLFVYLANHGWKEPMPAIASGMRLLKRIAAPGERDNDAALGRLVRPWFQREEKGYRLSEHFAFGYTAHEELDDVVASLLRNREEKA